MTRPYTGADLSSEWIDIVYPATGECLQTRDITRAIRSFVRRMQPDEILVFEATSSRDERILRIVREEQTPFVRVDPAHSWHFARACNLPKTDRVDARMLSAFAAARNFAPQEPCSTARVRVAAFTSGGTGKNELSHGPRACGSVGKAPPPIERYGIAGEEPPETYSRCRSEKWHPVCIGAVCPPGRQG